MSKLNIQLKEQFIIEDLEEQGAMYSYLNPASIGNLISSGGNKITYYIDGGLLAMLLTILLGRRIQRVSFDYTSIADLVFKKLSEDSKSVYLFGASQLEVDAFASKLKNVYPNLAVVGYSNGYVKKESWGEVTSAILELNVDFTLVGLGAGLQEEFLEQLKESGYSGVGYSCGGFIRQESNSLAIGYYPKLINSLKLRWLYRMYKEPHTIARYLIDYPRNMLRVTVLFLFRKLNFSIR